MIAVTLPNALCSSIFRVKCFGSLSPVDAAASVSTIEPDVGFGPVNTAAVSTINPVGGCGPVDAAIVSTIDPVSGMVP